MSDGEQGICSLPAHAVLVSALARPLPLARRASDLLPHLRRPVGLCSGHQTAVVLLLQRLQSRLLLLLCAGQGVCALVQLDVIGTVSLEAAPSMRTPEPLLCAGRGVCALVPLEVIGTVSLVAAPSMRALEHLLCAGRGVCALVPLEVTGMVSLEAAPSMRALEPLLCAGVGLGRRRVGCQRVGSFGSFGLGCTSWLNGRHDELEGPSGVITRAIATHRRPLPSSSQRLLSPRPLSPGPPRRASLCAPRPLLPAVQSACRPVLE